MSFRLSVFAMSGGVVCLMLSGCGLYRAAQIDNSVPPPPVVRSPKALDMPPDLRAVPPFRPVARTVAASGAAGASMVAPVDAGQSAAVAKQAHVSQAVVREQEPPKALFAPYFPSSNEKALPSAWVVTPNYDFPWIAGAVPDRVNEETTYGVGSDMFGRLFAKVAFGAENLAKSVDSSSGVVKEDAQKRKLTSVMPRWFSSGNTKKNEPSAQGEGPKPAHAASMVCAAATCLDAARDMLQADAQSKGWKMLLNRRVSLHQSFQFDRNGRVIWIEVDSDGKNGLKIEYALLPMQNGK